MNGATAKRGTHGLRKRCPICKKLRKFRETDSGVGGEYHRDGRRPNCRATAWSKVAGRWVCAFCVTRGLVEAPQA